MTGTDPASELLTSTGAEYSTKLNSACLSRTKPVPGWVLPGTYSGETNLPSLSTTNARPHLTTAFMAVTLRGFSQDPVTPGIVQT